MLRFVFLLVSISLIKGETDVNFLVVFEDGAQVKIKSLQYTKKNFLIKADGHFLNKSAMDRLEKR